MEQLFNLLTSSARLNKSQKTKNQQAISHTIQTPLLSSFEKNRHDKKSQVKRAHAEDSYAVSEDEDEQSHGSELNQNSTATKHNNNTLKKVFSDAKLQQIHDESVRAFRNKMGIRLSVQNKHDPTIPSPISSFDQITPPSWWCTPTTWITQLENPPSSSKKAKRPTLDPKTSTKITNPKDTSRPVDEAATALFHRIYKSILHNIENGEWINPTPIQMQCIPSLLARRDVVGCAPTGSGKSGAFLIPMLLLSSCPEIVFYGSNSHICTSSSLTECDESTWNLKNEGKRKRSDPPKNHPTNIPSTYSSKADTNMSPGGGIRALILAPSRELAHQLYREAMRLGEGKIGGVRGILLSKSNVGSLLEHSHSSSTRAHGNKKEDGTTTVNKRGWDFVVSTPLRLVECLEGRNMHGADKTLDLSRVRIVVLDEADRLLDASDGVREREKTFKSEKKAMGMVEDDSENMEDHAQSKTFVSQVDIILAAIPPTATRALFSATIGTSVRQLSESILRNAIDISIFHTKSSNMSIVGGSAVASSSSSAALGVNANIRQSLQFVGNEEGKLLAIRQLIQKGFHPPALVFLQSQERSQALYQELLYDRLRVDVLHAGRSQAARDKAVARFRSGETWILICTDLCARGIDFKAANLVINYDLPDSGVTYVHRIGRTGRGGRNGEAITLFTESDFPNLRKIANVMKLSGCEDIPEWMLNLKAKKM